MNSNMNSRQKIVTLLEQKSALLVLLLLIIYGTIAFNNRFPTLLNIMDLLKQSSFLGIIAVGETMAILTGGIDLSVGSTFALASVMTCYTQDLPAPVMLLIPLLIGMVVGLFNGFVITKMNITPFLATLATMMGIRGIAYLVTNGGVTMQMSNAGFIAFSRVRVFGFLPTPAIIFILIILLGMLFMRYTSTGRNVYAIGGNMEAARMMGVNLDKTLIFVYAVSGVLSALAGCLLTARMSSGDPTSGLGYEMTAIASAVLGGNVLTGGVGKVSGTFFGILALSTIGNLMNMQGKISPAQQNVIMGAIILIIILFQSQLQKYRLEKA